MSLKRPLVGILYNFTSPIELAEAIRSFQPEIQLDVIVTGESGVSDEDLDRLKSCQILIVDPNIIVDRSLERQLPNLKWMHSLWAGVDRLTRSISRSGHFPNYVLTRNGDFYGSQMAEYAIGFIIARERHFFAMQNYQQEKLWKRLPYRSLSEVTVGIVGFGDIGKEVARVAKSLHTKVIALVRTMPTEDQKSSHVDKYWSNSDIPMFLSSSDYVINLLPSFTSTDHFFDGDVLKNCAPKKTVFINIGRGNVISEKTILHALESGWIGGAILDVFQVEPLPVDSPLWTHPLVTVTPHLSGLCLKSETAAKKFSQNYELFLQGNKLLYEVDWAKGY